MCPHCGTSNCVMQAVYRNVENYGDNTFHIPCIYCGKMICVVATRTVKIIGVTKSNQSESRSDF